MSLCVFITEVKVRQELQKLWQYLHAHLGVDLNELEEELHLSGARGQSGGFASRKWPVVDEHQALKGLSLADYF